LVKINKRGEVRKGENQEAAETNLETSYAINKIVLAKAQEI